MMARRSFSSARVSGDPLADPFAVPFYLRFCEAIGRFTAAWVAADPAIFRVRGADLRYVVETRGAVKAQILARLLVPEIDALYLKEILGRH